MSFIDVHNHLAQIPTADLQDRIVRRLRKLGCMHSVCGGIHPTDWMMQKSLRCTYPSFVSCSSGIHPWEIQNRKHEQLDIWLDALHDELTKHQVKILGEVGLDFSMRAVDKEKQKKYFALQLDLAALQRVPVIIHCVRGYGTVVDILEHRKQFLHGGIVHGFRGDFSLAKRFTDLGFYVAIGPHARIQEHPDHYAWLAKIPFVMESDAPQYTLHIGDLTKNNKDSAEELVRATGLDTIPTLANFIGQIISRPTQELLEQSNQLAIRVLKLQV